MILDHDEFIMNLFAVSIDRQLSLVNNFHATVFSEADLQRSGKWRTRIDTDELIRRPAQPRGRSIEPENRSATTMICRCNRLIRDLLRIQIHMHTHTHVLCHA